MMTAQIPQKTRQKLYWRAAALIIIIAGTCALLSGYSRKRLADRSVCKMVAQLVDGVTKNAKVQAHVFRQLEDLGDAAVPCIVSHLDDMRELPNPQISFTNRDAGIFEEHAHYGAEFVHDALSAILRQMTGEDIGAFNADRPPDERPVLRERNRHRWIRWCRAHYPERTTECGKVSSAH